MRPIRVGVITLLSEGPVGTRCLHAFPSRADSDKDNTLIFTFTKNLVKLDYLKTTNITSKVATDYLEEIALSDKTPLVLGSNLILPNKVVDAGLASWSHLRKNRRTYGGII